MAKKITFAEFKNSVDTRALTMMELQEYIEEDPFSPVPKLRFKGDALIDTAPAEYDVDMEIYKMMRAIEKDKVIERFGFAKSPDVIAEGDSWFRHMCIRWFYPCAIANVISQNEKFNTENIAFMGHTLAEIVAEKEYMRTIKPNDTEFFMLSGGGNDLQEGIKIFIHDYKKERPLEEYLTPEGQVALALIGKRYKEILSEVSSSFPKVKILCHGYDYPRPKNGSKYIGKYLEEKCIPEDKMNGVMDPLIDKLNTVIITEVKEVTQATFIDLRGVTKDFIWYDDMHPNTDGFTALAGKFESHMLEGKGKLHM